MLSRFVRLCILGFPLSTALVAQEPPAGWIGLRIEQVTNDLGDALKINRAGGALVIAVDPWGPAKTAGIEVGDVVVKFDDRDIKDAVDLRSMVAKTVVGKNVKIIVVREGKEAASFITVESREKSRRDDPGVPE